MGVRRGNLRRRRGRRSAVCLAVAAAATAAFAGVSTASGAHRQDNSDLEITKMSATKGPVTGGTVVHIIGRKKSEVTFSGVENVYFGSVPAASFTLDSSKEITATSAPNTAERVIVKVVTDHGTTDPEYCKNRGKDEPGLCAVKDYFKFEDPVVSGVSPAGGPVAGGTLVTLTGAGFGLAEGETEVLFGSYVATSVECTSTTTCTAVAPAAAKAGSEEVRVDIHSNEPGMSKKSRLVSFAYE